MSTDLELIHRLVLEELAGVISDEDLAYLKKTIREDPEAFNVWLETRNLLDTPDVKEFLAKPRPVDLILEKIQRRKGPGSWVFSLSIAVTFIAGLWFFHYFYPPSQKVPAAAIPVVSSKSVRIDLPGNGTIDLSQNKGTVKVNSVTLQSSGGALSYKADNITARLATLTVPSGKDYKINLNDGTVVWLNSATTLRFPLNFTDGMREIYLKGEAYLEVAKSSNPFIVHLPNGTVKVLGTSFNVNTYDSSTIKVALVSGSVKVETETDALQLYPGQELSLQEQKKMQVQPFDTATLLSWRQGLYIFNNMSVEEIVKVIPRWFGKEVVFDNVARKKARFTGVINRNLPVENSLDILKATNEFDFEIVGNLVHIK